ncbi:TRAP transporter small permease [Aquibium sp. LZ166]|uniref:TRAP transporter small permease protein n=1 Tax=Aquibium pacificus TaxID=3153579 RepID=A0ABV3SN77_9HYPH
MLRKLYIGINRVTLFIGGLAILAITLLGGADIIVTLIFQRPIAGVFEATQTLMVVAVFLGLGMVHLNRSYISVDIAYDAMPSFGQRLSDTLTLLLMLCFFGALAWRGWGNALQSWRVGEYTSGIVQFPIYPAKFALAAGCTLAAISCVVDLVAGARFRKPAVLREE